MRTTWAAVVLLAALFASGCAISSDGAVQAVPASPVASAVESAPRPTATVVVAVEAVEAQEVTPAQGGEQPGAEDPQPTTTPEPTRTPEPIRTPEPTRTPEPRPTPVPTVVPSPEPTRSVLQQCAAPTRVEPDPNRTTYELNLAFDVLSRTVAGSQEARFTPDLDIDRLVLRLWPNGPRQQAGGNQLVLRSLRVDGELVDWQEPDPTTVVVQHEAAAGETLTIAADWTLTIGGPANDRLAAGDGWLRIATFHPLLPWEPGVGWAEEPPTAGFAEAVMTPTADYAVTIAGLEDLDVLATGLEPDPGVWRAVAVRDFALTAGTFDLRSTVVAIPDPVVVTIGVQSGVGESPDVYLDRVTASLELYSSLWGAYPWPALSLSITPSLRGGIEFPGHIMQGPGTSGRTTVHEVAHMWFYGLVGNNQGRDPWIDEGLASYAEFRFDSIDIAGLGVPADVFGNAGEPMTFWEARLGSYYQGVYVAPAVALDAAGAVDDVDCALRDFVASNAFGIATPEDFFESAQRHLDGSAAALAPFGLRPGS